MLFYLRVCLFSFRLLCSQLSCYTEGTERVVCLARQNGPGAILFGQTIIKVVYAISSIKKRNYKLEMIIVVISGTMVLGLAPSLIVLSIMLTSETPSIGMISLQLILFVIGLATFLTIGMLAHWVRASWLTGK